MSSNFRETEEYYEHSLDICKYIGPVIPTRGREAHVKKFSLLIATTNTERCNRKICQNLQTLFKAFDVKKNSVFAGDPDGYAPDITFTIDDADLMDMALGRISSAKALFARKLKIDGDLKLAMKFDYWKYMKFRIDE